MKFIKLTQDKQAIVDDSDYERLSKFKWCYHLGYAIRYAGGGRKQRRFERMHRVVNNTPDGFFTDHINRNKLDNRRANLRTVKHRENSINRGLQSNNTSEIQRSTQEHNPWEVGGYYYVSTTNPLSGDV